MAFRKELEQLINKHSKENSSNIPDFILIDYLNNCLINFDNTLNARKKWWFTNKEKWSGGLTVDKNLKVEIISENSHLKTFLSLSEKIKLAEKWWNNFDNNEKIFLCKKLLSLNLTTERLSRENILELWEINFKIDDNDTIEHKKSELIDHPNFHNTKEEKLKAANKWWHNLPYNESINILAKYDKKDFSVDILEIWIEETKSK